MEEGSEGRNWNGGLRCSGCERELGEEFTVEIQEWNGEKKLLCTKCLERWLRGE
jgi:hypothetical protein